MNSYRTKVLVTGSTGMLGKDIIEELSLNKKYQVIGMSRRKLERNDIEQVVVELTEKTALLECLKAIDPAVIIHCAANTDVENCEKNQSYARSLHVDSTFIMATYKPQSVKLIYISSDGVFDGEKGDYVESSQVNPLNYYHTTKYQGELMAAANKNSLVLRTNIYGFHRPSTNSLVEWAVLNWKKGNTIRGYNDVFFNPLYSRQLAELIVEFLAMPDLTGILNVGSDQHISKYNFLVQLAEEFGYNKDMVTTASVDLVDYIAKRPKNTTLDVSQLLKFSKKLPSLNDGIKKLKFDLEGVDLENY